MNDSLERLQDTDDELDEKEQFVSFIVGKEVFAGDMAPVKEIIRVPELVRVPLAPDCLEGLANLRGSVLPIISLRRIFGFDHIEPDETSRAIVIDIGQPLGFIVDKVASVIEVDKGSVEPATTIQSAIDNDLLSGIIKNVGGFDILMILNFTLLIEHQFSGLKAALEVTANQSYGAEMRNELEENSDELQLVSFGIANEEYAVDINNVKEIVNVPENLVSVPNSSPHILGIMTLRKHVLPLVSLRRMFHFESKPLDESCRIVVVDVSGIPVGIVTDYVSQVLRVDKSDIEDLPRLFSANQSINEISSICQLDSGKRLVSIIDIDCMFENVAIKEAVGVANNHEDAEDSIYEDIDEEDSEEEQIVVFKLDNCDFGVSIKNVQEIVRIPEELTHVPKAPPFVEGIINLRGSVLPVIDQRKRLHMNVMERNDRQRIMVFMVNGIRSGFIVDAVTEVLKVHRSKIEEAPNLSPEQAKLLGRVVNIGEDKRMIQLISASELFTEQEAKSLDQIAAD